MPKHGIIVVDGTGSTHLLHHVKIRNQKYPVSPQTAMSKYFFAVRHIGVLYTKAGAITDPRGKDGRITYYFSPDAYFSANYMPKEDEEMDELDENTRADLYRQREEYKKKHKSWYDFHEQIKQNPQKFIDDTRATMWPPCNK